MSISLGTGSNNNSFTMDIGSGVLLATCKTPQSLPSCWRQQPPSATRRLQYDRHRLHAVPIKNMLPV